MTPEITNAWWGHADSNNGIRSVTLWLVREVEREEGK